MFDHDVAIIGGGISGLTALHYLRSQKPELTVHLFESDTRLGGTIGTDHVDGYSFDWGPNGFLDREPLTLQLCDELGLKDELERANNNVSNRFILRGGRLRSVPMSPPAFMRSDILSWPGKLRLMWEPFASGPPDGVDESIYDFVRRRIGHEAADYLVQPMVSGVYGGMADRLSLKSCFSIMHKMESEHGSLFKAMMAKKREAKKSGKRSGGPAGPAGWLTSFHGGLFKIIERFGERYGDSISTGKCVSETGRDEGRTKLIFTDGSSASGKSVILALPSNHASKITKRLSAKLAGALASIEYAPISVVCLGYDQNAIESNLDGFGFLVPAREPQRILGSIWTSSIFRDRAPKGKVQFRTMIGGDGDHDSQKLSDDQLIELTRRDLGQILKIKGEPEMVRIYRWEHGIPQFKIGHSDRLAAIEKELNRLGDLYVTGNAYYGIGLNDCVKQSHRVVQDILQCQR